MAYLMRVGKSKWGSFVYCPRNFYVPHPVPQKGNRRLPVFFSDDDRREYLGGTTLRTALEGSDASEEGEAIAEAIEARLRTGRPLASDEWIERQEAALGRPMRPAKPGPKPNRRTGVSN